jgi:hypothetical protein
MKGDWNRFTPERFWAKVDIGGPDDCWEWTGTKNKKFKHGRVGKDYKLVLAHRLSWELTNGPIPEGICVCHKCDNPPCCNPNHLFLGTKKDNMQDMIKKGRSNYLNGEAHGSAKLTTAQVLEILRVGKARTSTEWAAEFGVSRSCIKHVWSRRTHLEADKVAA